jgi:putative CocE/NonD family hydrolase
VRPRRLVGAQPRALRFTIYSDPAFNLKSAKDAAAHGYVGVLASARGKYLSRDGSCPGKPRRRTTWAVIDWISRQPWSNGKVGMYGNSYDAVRAMGGREESAPCVKTIVPSGRVLPATACRCRTMSFRPPTMAGRCR